MTRQEWMLPVIFGGVSLAIAGLVALQRRRPRRHIYRAATADTGPVGGATPACAVAGTPSSRDGDRLGGERLGGERLGGDSAGGDSGGDGGGGDGGGGGD